MGENLNGRLILLEDHSPADRIRARTNAAQHEQLAKEVENHPGRRTR